MFVEEDTHLFNIHHNIVLSSRPKPSYMSVSLGAPVNILKEILPSILTT